MTDETEKLIQQSIPTETVESIRRAVPLEPNSAQTQPSDSSRNPPDAQRPPRAKYDPPYIMGSTTTGSGTFTADPFTWGDPTNTRGPWGGDPPPSDDTTARTDTWHRDRPPRDASGDRTWGVKCDLIRIYEKPLGTTPETYTTYIFERQAVFDAQGTPVYVTGETLINSGAIAEKTPLKRHPFEAYWTGLTTKTDAVDVFVARGSVCRGDERQVGVAITAGDGTLDSIWTLTAALPFLYIKCVFEASGVISYLTFDQTSAAISPLFVLGGGGTDSNTWYHPILHYRASVTTKSTANSLTGNPFPDSGEERTGGGTAGWTVYQLTNTHLVGQQMCMTAESGTIYTAWKLVPGPGATSGAGS